MGQIPRQSQDCVMCYRQRCNGELFCKDHPSGADYTGDEVYEPSDFVRSVVGKKFQALDGLFLCTGYDRRCGFWMKSLERDDDLRNVSERAIGGTYHQVWR